MLLKNCELFKNKTSVTLIKKEKDIDGKSARLEKRKRIYNLFIFIMITKQNESNLENNLKVIPK